MAATKDRPTLVLARGKELTLEQVVSLFKKLTGRDPTPEDIEQTKATLAKASGTR